MAKITIQTTDSVVNFDATIDFGLQELPYYAVGYKNNGTSMANVDNLDKYWAMIDDFFATVGIDIESYVTLLSIEDN